MEGESVARGCWIACSELFSKLSYDGACLTPFLDREPGPPNWASKCILLDNMIVLISQSRNYTKF